MPPKQKAIILSIDTERKLMIRCEKFAEVPRLLREASLECNGHYQTEERPAIDPCLLRPATIYADC